METFGVRVDPEKNRDVSTYPVDVAAPDSPVRIVVLLTNEELAIARRTHATLTESRVSA
jgi:acetate kinase